MLPVSRQCAEFIAHIRRPCINTVIPRTDFLRKFHECPAVIPAQGAQCASSQMDRSDSASLPHHISVPECLRRSDGTRDTVVSDFRVAHQAIGEHRPHPRDVTGAVYTRRAKPWTSSSPAPRCCCAIKPTVSEIQPVTERAPPASFPGGATKQLLCFTMATQSARHYRLIIAYRPETIAVTDAEPSKRLHSAIL